MIRLATPNDAEQLYILNEHFNGPHETVLEKITESLNTNDQELVVVAEEDNILVGFVCVQIKKSFCYSCVSAEITEVFVEEMYRRKKIASNMIAFAEKYCRENYELHKFELLTGRENYGAQVLYNALGYSAKDEILMAKYI